MQDLSSPSGDLDPIERAYTDELRTRAGRMDQLAVHVERRTGTAQSDAEQASTRLSNLVKNTIGVTITASVLEPDSIERSMGKMRRIVDHRPR